MNNFIKLVNSFFLGISGGLILPFSLVFLFLPAMLTHPSITSVGTFIVGIIMSVMYIAVLMSYNDLKRQKGMISGYLSKFSKCSFHKYNLSDYAERDSSISIESQDISHPLHNIGVYQNRRNIQIYVVKRGQSPILPNQLAAYESYQHSSPSYIFSRDEPDKITPLGRFFIYHEIGHSSWRQTDVRLVSRFGWSFFLFPLPWVIINTQYTFSSIIALIIYIGILVVSYPVFKYLLQEAHFYDEVNADRFALSLLTDKTRTDLKNYLQRAGFLPTDPSLKKTQNLKRYTILMKSINNSEYKNTYNSIPVGLVYLQFLCAMVILFLGYTNRQPSLSLLCCNSVFLIFLFGAGLVIVGQKLELTKKIEGYFS